MSENESKENEMTSPSPINMPGAKILTQDENRELVLLRRKVLELSNRMATLENENKALSDRLDAVESQQSPALAVASNKPMDVLRMKILEVIDASPGVYFTPTTMNMQLELMDDVPKFDYDSATANALRSLVTRGLIDEVVRNNRKIYISKKSPQG